MASSQYSRDVEARRKKHRTRIGGSGASSSTGARITATVPFPKPKPERVITREPEESGNWVDEKIAESGPGKWLAGVLNTSGGSLVMKLLGTTGAATQPLVEDLAGRGGNVARTIRREAEGTPFEGVVKALGGVAGAGDVNYKSKNRDGYDGMGLVGHTGEMIARGRQNVVNLWAGDPANPAERVRSGVDVFDAAVGFTESQQAKLEQDPLYSVGRAAAGLVSDIGTDPLSYVTGAGALKTARVAKRTLPGTKGAKTTADLAEAAGGETPGFARRFIDDWNSSESMLARRNPMASSTAGKRALQETPQQLKARVAEEATNTAKVARDNAQAAAKRSEDALRAAEDALPMEEIEIPKPVQPTYMEGNPARLAPDMTRVAEGVADRVSEAANAAKVQSFLSNFMESTGKAAKDVIPKFESRELNIPAPFNVVDELMDRTIQVPAPNAPEALNIPTFSVLESSSALGGTTTARKTKMVTPAKPVPLPVLKGIIETGKIKSGARVTNESLRSLRQQFVKATGIQPEDWVVPATDGPHVIDQIVKEPTGNKVTERWADAASPESLPGQNMNTWRRSLGRMVKQGKITKSEFEELKKAAKSPDIKAFEELVQRINGTPVATMSDDVVQAASEIPITQEVLDSVRINTPESRMQASLDDVDNLLKVKFNDVDVDLLPAFKRVWEKHFAERVARYNMTGDYNTASPIQATRLNETAKRGDNIEGYNSPTQTEFVRDVMRDTSLAKTITEAMRKAGIEPLPSTTNPGKYMDDDGIKAVAMKNILTAATERMRRLGVEPSLGYGKTGRPLAYSDIMEIVITGSRPSLSQKVANQLNIPLPKRAAAFMFGNAGAAVPPSNLLDAVDNMMGYVMEDAANLARFKAKDPGILADIVQELLKTQAPKADGTLRQIDSALTGGKNKHWRAGAAAKWNQVNRLRDGSRIPEARFALHMAEQYADMLADAAPELYQTMIANAQRAGLSEVMETRKLTVDFFEKAQAAFDSPKMSDNIKAAEDPGAIIREVAEEISAKPSAEAAAKLEVKEGFDKLAPRLFREEIKETVKVASANIEAYEKSLAGPRAAVEASNKALKAAQEKFEKAVARAEEGAIKAGEPMDLDAVNERAIETGIASKLSQVFHKFAYHAGKSSLGEAFMIESKGSRNIAVGLANELNKLNRLFGGLPSKVTDESMLFHAFHLIQTGGDVVPEAKAAVDALRPMVEGMFSTDPKAVGLMSSVERIAAVQDDVFTREFGNSLKHINMLMERADLDFQFDLSAKSLADITAQWKKWEIKDPLDFMQKMQHVMVTASRNAAVAQQALSLAKKAGGLSNKPKPGYVRIVSSEGKSELSGFFPTDAYFHPEIAAYIKNVDGFMREIQAPNNRLYTLLRDRVMPIQDIWKSGMTIWNPRHHAANLIGDASMTLMAGHGGAYGRAMSIVRQRGYLKTAEDGTPQYQKLFGVQDELNAQVGRSGGVKQTPAAENATAISNSKPIVSVRLKGSRGELTRLTGDDIFRGIMERGGLPATPIRESMGDVFDEFTSNTEVTQTLRDRLSITNKFGKNKGGASFREAKLVPFSEARDHFARLAHFIPAIEKNAKNFSNLDDLLDFAAAEVRKWHPDGSGMTPFEQRWMRLIMPFYSWSRKAIPLTIESLFTKPGRVLMYPKAMYAVAQSQGVELQSLGDPFPVDQVFPSFLREQITGPLYRMDGNYTGLRPGIFYADILGEFGGGSVADAAANGGVPGALDVGPTRGFLNMISPLAKYPLEAMTGTSFGTGARVTDQSDALDSQVPGVNTVAQLSGFSPSGSIVNNLFGRPLEAAQGQNSGIPVLDPTRQREKESLDQGRNLRNYLMGLRETNMSQESYINLAEIEARDRATYKRF